MYWRSGSHSAHWLTSWVRSLPWGLGVSLQLLSLINCFGSFSPSTLRLSLNPRASPVGDRVCPPWPESPRPLWSLPSDLQRPERASGGRGGGERSQGVCPSPSRPWFWQCCAPSLRAQRLSLWPPSQGSNTDWVLVRAPPSPPLQARGGNDSPQPLVPGAAPRPAHTLRAPFITLSAVNPQKVPSASCKDLTDPILAPVRQCPLPPP